MGWEYSGIAGLRGWNEIDGDFMETQAILNKKSGCKDPGKVLATAYL